MDWWQLLFTIISSSALTAFITGVFDCKTIKETNKENDRQRKFDSDSKTLHEEKLKEEQNRHQKAENLYKIISPATKCEALRIYIKNPQQYNINSLGYVTNCEEFYTEIMKFLKQAEMVFKVNHPGEINLSSYIKKLIKNDLEIQYNLTEFFQRYNKGTYENIEIDVEKLNKDIDFINKELNLYIENF